MDKKIIKVIYDDETEISVQDLKTLEQIKKDYTYDKEWKFIRHYNRQFQTIEKDVLWSLEDDFVKEYAKDYLALKNEDDNDCDCEDKTILDYEDNELVSELARRNLFGYDRINIISIDLFTRFSRIMTIVSSQELESVITELENKHNL